MAKPYRKRTQIKNVKLSDTFSTCLVADVAQSTQIFINENLTLTVKEKDHEKWYAVK